MLYTGSALEQQELQAMPLADANPRPNRRIRRIPWGAIAWAMVLAVVTWLMGRNW
ncbi:hypothetical protein V6C53_05040 [Desulfocurvibacter africanus]|uniref:Uncharacterized protein n=1 Tax=Desulfocurvibacter africanus subsp. africanus str. Walvis Bay TaxID=690850 RepID=F3YY87_DESAF|nr:hypothetical protein [Desulfocurvibacter africanus]EGJ51863.1 hypothetical protein Desaf_3584 [Desulfocurvibacter africanus subsp. africanus str. Walvis Bay]